MAQEESQTQLPGPDGEKRMGLFDHIDELRARLMRSLWVFMIGFCASYFLVTEKILTFLRAPLFAVLPPDQRKLYFTNLFENFMTHLKISAYASILVVSPYLLYELWSFIAPGLYPKERKWVIPFITAGSVFFAGGAFFAYYVLFPVAFKFFVTYGSPTDMALLTIDSFYGTCVKLMLLFGLAFEFPVILCFLGFLGIIDGDTLATHRKTATLAITVMSALFAPPDAVSMLVLMGPLLVMYEGSIHVVRWFGKRRKARMAAEGVGPGPS